MSRERFDYCRQARNHVAGQAFRDGVIMDGETLDDVPDCNGGYPENWPDIPDIKERLLASYRNLRVFDLTIEQLPNDQESYGFHAQQSVENAVKAWVSATGLSYRRSTTWTNWPRLSSMTRNKPPRRTRTNPAIPLLTG